MSLTITQTQNLEMIAQFRSCQCQHRWRKEHGLVVRMCDQETYPLVVQPGKIAGERGGRSGREAPENEDGGDGKAQGKDVGGGGHFRRLSFLPPLGGLKRSGGSWSSSGLRMCCGAGSGLVGWGMRFSAFGNVVSPRSCLCRCCYEGSVSLGLHKSLYLLLFVVTSSSSEVALSPMSIDQGMALLASCVLNAEPMQNSFPPVKTAALE